MAAFLLLLTILIVLWIVISNAMRSSIEHLASSEDLVEIHDEATLPAPGFDMALETAEDWARRRGFSRDVTFDFHGAPSADPIRCSMWRNDKAATTLVMYWAMATSHFDFVTPYVEDKSLTTSGSLDAMMLPTANGCYVQAFPDAELDTLLDQHKAGRLELESARSLGRTDLPDDLIAWMTDVIGRQVRHVQAIPLWAWRGPYWYLVRRRTMANRDVREQLRRAA